MNLHPDVCHDIKGWFPPPHGIDAIRERFGDITVKGEQVVSPKGWESSNMVKVPELPGYDRPLYVNRLIVPMLERALLRYRFEATLQGEPLKLKTLGCFAPRMKRSAAGALSLHSWGIAIDVNADDNPPMRLTTSEDLWKRKSKIPDRLVSAFESVGFVWGGRFSSYYDPMHFQYASGI